MNRYWLAVFGAAFFEVFWVVGLKHADTALEWGGTVVSILVSFFVLIKSSERLPVGTVYAVFVGLGTAGTVCADILWFGAEADPVKLILIGTLLIGVIGLKQATKEAA